MRVVFIWLIISLLGHWAGAQEGYPPTFPGSQEEVYKTVDQVELKLWIFSPAEHDFGSAHPAIVFFFGGGWRGGTPAQFKPHAEYLAARGMVAILADYRVKSRHGVNPDQCVSDAKSAVRWIRENAARLGIDPNRIGAGGGSAGGHLAAATATLEGLESPGEDLEVSSIPNALVLFNPVLVLDDVEDDYAIPDRLKELFSRFEVTPASLSPYHHLGSHTGPTIIFHGTADGLVPYQTAQLFCQKLRAQGQVCKLIGYEGEDHAFFNYGRKNNGPYVDTVIRMDEFLVSVGFLEALPRTTIE